MRKPPRLWTRRRQSSNLLTGDFNLTIIIPRGFADEVINQISAALQDYEKDHPRAEIALYRFRI